MSEVGGVEEGMRAGEGLEAGVVSIGLEAGLGAGTDVSDRECARSVHGEGRREISPLPPETIWDKDPVSTLDWVGDVRAIGLILPKPIYRGCRYV